MSFLNGLTTKAQRHREGRASGNFACVSGKVDGLCSAATLHRVPKVFEEDGFVFFFYSNDHEPIHVHVRYSSGEAVFVVEPMIELRESSGIRVHDLRRAQELAEQNKELIVRKWHEHLG